MIRIIFSIFILMALNSCTNKTQKAQASKTNVSKTTKVDAPLKKKGFEMTFDQRMVDFGVVKKGDKRTHTYTFTNTGDEDIIIEIISACDCTTLTYDANKPYKPGQSGTIKAVFDSSRKEEGETIDIDLILKNIDPQTGYQRIERVQYKFELEN